ncbi:hypothetical protein KTT_20930 [Tengunoibacter tsumagoiensis]|uniref:Cas12f1-like TNB domain-containing protein n=1 Tax=Tengunoibacter tsumagoiensis TaxID=2014871 RepID=A0A401ZZF1_9CHLR|nr:zinc ribbon domain-containing protein [Tengunoibacter tsumagoiensis]GCE12234.1 hypothetical protein KTT_20930 [Tengunoibacter tsumagoiensis]
MAKTTITLRQTLTCQPNHHEWFATNQALFNRVVCFYFDVINAHENLLQLSNKEALTALEKLTHTTKETPDPIMPLQALAPDIPALFRRAAINAALGSARSFFSHLYRWRAQKTKAEARGKKYKARPPVPPRTWNKSVPLYAGMWKERTAETTMVKIWNGTCWNWVKVRTQGRDVAEGYELGSPSLVCKGATWRLHTPLEKTFKGPAKIAEQVTDPDTKLCSVDLNFGENLAVCVIQTAKGTPLASTFLKGGKELNGFRKQQLGKIARNRNKTGLIAEGEQDNAALWCKIRDRDEDLAHQISVRIIQFAQQWGATILVFEHLGNLKPEKGKYSRRGNSKRAFWMKGRIFAYSKYKAYNAGILTSRVSPRNTSRECARCHAPVARYRQGQPAQGYTVGAPLVSCSACSMKGNADRNAALVVGQRLITRHQKKPSTPHAGHERDA